MALPNTRPDWSIGHVERAQVVGPRLAAGAGYLYALAGDVVTMPGLPSHPWAAEIDLDDTGQIVGLV